MRVFVPATPTGLHPATLPSILRDGYQAHVVPMTGVESYYELIGHLWAEMEDFAIVEHDMELHTGALESFERCPNLWCAFSYEVFAGDIAEAYGGPFGLGCCRFRKELLIEFPDAVVEAGKMDIHPVHPPRSYAVMDSTLTHWLRGPYNQKVCQHRPNVTHHHRYLRAGAFWPTPLPQ